MRGSAAVADVTPMSEKEAEAVDIPTVESKMTDEEVTQDTYTIGLDGDYDSPVAKVRVLCLVNSCVIRVVLIALPDSSHRRHCPIVTSTNGNIPRCYQAVQRQSRVAPRSKIQDHRRSNTDHLHSDKMEQRAAHARACIRHAGGELSDNVYMSN